MRNWIGEFMILLKKKIIPRDMYWRMTRVYPIGGQSIVYIRVWHKVARKLSLARLSAGRFGSLR